MIPWPPFGTVDRLCDEAKLLRGLVRAFLRVSVGTPDEHARLVALLQEAAS